MREIDEAEEQAVMRKKQKNKVLATIALGVVGVSLYGWWNKTLEPVPATLQNRGEVVEASRMPQSEIVVYISGFVAHPGVIKISAGSRAIDVVNAAGGLLPGADVSRINLAQALKDGVQVHVPGQSGMARENGPSQYELTGGQQIKSTQGYPDRLSVETKININTAEASELDTLPGIGPAMAQKIVEWRNANGPFKSGEDLKKVKGIGESKYLKLKEKISW